jgi:pimeloyl-ACP methyl ester carboxylesterase
MKKLIFFISYLISTSFIIAQPNLILSNGSTTSTSIKRGDYLKLTLRISNIGNTAASKSHTQIYVSSTLSFTNAILLSEISCEALTAGQETKDTDFIYPLPYTISTGSNYILIKVDSRNEVIETDEVNGYRFIPIINVITVYGGQQNLPYPVILMHGLNGNDTTWYPFLRNIQSFYGYSYGGNFDYCLNQDASTSNSYLFNDVKNWTDTTQLGIGDFYTVNFDLDHQGNKYNASSKSNQSAIVKQGYAMSRIIKQVLDKTGRNKVILVGHSMGGLTCREYLQNTILWQSNGNHQVAKLLTNGTPNGGSNSTAFGLLPIDEKSEAVRDLRRDYFFGGNGVYLFGGLETNSNIRNNLIYPYDNVDVNCDGINNSGNFITGLNYKSFPTNISYASIIGEDPSTILCGVTSEKCDGVVNITSANLNKYLNVNADTFYCKRNGSSASSPLHTELPRQTDFMIKGLDEANEYNLSYEIDTSRIYLAHFSVQSKTGYFYDYDDYKITISQNGSFNCKIYNIPISKLYINLLDTNNNLIFRDSTNGQGYYELNTNLLKGKYFLEFYCKPEEITWYYPYAFKTTLKPLTPIVKNVILAHCDKITYNGKTYTASTIQKDTIKTNWGADSIYNIADLRINNITAITNSIIFTNCNSIVYKTKTYTSSTILRDTLKSYQGCDSIYNIANLNILNGIFGSLNHPTKGGIKNVKVKLTGGFIDSLTANNTYSFGCNNQIFSGTLKPSKNNDFNKANGVTSIDVLLTQRHILNTSKLNSAYKIIAADVTGDRQINSQDVLRIRRLILGTDTTFRNTLTNENRLWAFVDSVYQFPDTTNPFPFKDSISFANLTSNKINQTFIGVKLGDVNYDWNPAIARQSSATNRSSTVTLEVTRSTNFSGFGETYNVSVANFKDIAAMQYTLHFDHRKYELVNLEGFKNLQGLDYNAAQANTTGNIAMLWTDKDAVAKTLEDGTTIFTIVLRKKVEGNVSFELNNDIAEIEAYNKDLDKLSITLNQKIAQLETPITKQWFSIYPNPTKGKIMVESKGVKHIEFVDLLGRISNKQIVNSERQVMETKLPKGVYIVKAIMVDGSIRNEKLIVQ